ncbi:MAG: hypothetical protein ABI556_06505 [Gemmatimonadales bacterium]
MRIAARIFLITLLVTAADPGLQAQDSPIQKGSIQIGGTGMNGRFRRARAFGNGDRNNNKIRNGTAGEASSDSNTYGIQWGITAFIF